MDRTVGAEGDGLRRARGQRYRCPSSRRRFRLPEFGVAFAKLHRSLDGVGVKGVESVLAAAIEPRMVPGSMRFCTAASGTF